MDLTNIAYRLKTPRLLLRCWAPSDAPALRAALDRSDQYLRPWIPFMADEPRSLAESVAWLRGHRTAFDRKEMFRFAVFAGDGNVLVGENMLLRRVGPGALELGYLTHLGFDGRGYATESSAALIRLAFERYQVERVEIHHARANEASAAIPRNLGFTLEETRSDSITDTVGDRHDCHIWRLHRGDYPSSPARKLDVSIDGALNQAP